MIRKILIKYKYFFYHPNIFLIHLNLIQLFNIKIDQSLNRVHLVFSFENML